MTVQTGITSDTYKKLYIDAGAVYLNYGEGGQVLLGATRGGNTFTIESEYRDMPVDGAKGPVKGSRRITSVNATLTANFVEMTTAILLRSLPGAVAADHPDTPTKTHDSITRSIAIALSDYATNIALVGQVQGAPTENVIVIVQNAINDGNAELAFAEADESVLSITFKAHFDPDNISVEPWEIRNPVIA